MWYILGEIRNSYKRKESDKIKWIIKTWGVDWIHLVQDEVQVGTLVDMVIKHWVP
jgi:hypothetical protein